MGNISTPSTTILSEFSTCYAHLPGFDILVLDYSILESTWKSVDGKLRQQQLRSGRKRHDVGGGVFATTEKVYYSTSISHGRLKTIEKLSLSEWARGETARCRPHCQTTHDQ